MDKYRYRIVFQKSAFKEYQGLSLKIKLKVDEVLTMLSINPYSEVLKLKKIRKKENHFRVRIGDCRMIYCPQLDILIVRVIRRGQRNEVYRHF